MIDFHCHLDLYPDPVAVSGECERRGLYVLSVTTTPSAWQQTSALTSESKRIRTAVGLHPQLAHERMSELSLFDEVLPHCKYVGEIGLDGSPEFRPFWTSQQAAFAHILTKCAEAGGRIMSIHSRRATGDVLDALSAVPGSGRPVLHWFSGPVRDIQRAVALGCWFSVGPAMLAGERGRSLVAKIPRDLVLTESDGPFAQVNGQNIMPWAVKDAVRGLAEVWKVNEATAATTVHDNLRRLLRSTSSASE